MIGVVPPYWYDRRTSKIWAMGTNDFETPVLDIRAWGHLTGKGHGALGLDDVTARNMQDEFGGLVAGLLNKHFQNEQTPKETAERE